MKITAGRRGIGFPDGCTTIQITCWGRPLTGRKWRDATVYPIPDLDQSQIRPDEIADNIPGHWHIENQLHWVPEVSFAEELGHTRTDHGHAVHGHSAEPGRQRPLLSRAGGHHLIRACAP